MELGNLIFGHSRGPYPINRESFENMCFDTFSALLDAVNCDSYGHYMGENKGHKSKLGGFKCDLFEINPYWWGECDCGADKNDEPHKDNCALCVPNFRYKTKSGDAIEIRWYKYPFRDSYSNVELSEEMFCHILKDCINYIKNLKEI